MDTASLTTDDLCTRMLALGGMGGCEGGTNHLRASQIKDLLIPFFGEARVERCTATLCGAPEPTPEFIGPPLDCPHEELVAYIRSMKGGERVMEIDGSCMKGQKGYVEVEGDSVSIRWDFTKYGEGAGVMRTSFTGGARIIKE